MLSCGQRDSSDKSRRSGHQNASATNALHCVSQCYSTAHEELEKPKCVSNTHTVQLSVWGTLQCSMWLEKLKFCSALGTPFQGAVHCRKAC